VGHCWPAAAWWCSPSWLWVCALAAASHLHPRPRPRLCRLRRPWAAGRRVWPPPLPPHPLRRLPPHCTQASTPWASRDAPARLDIMHAQLGIAVRVCRQSASTLNIIWSCGWFEGKGVSASRVSPPGPLPLSQSPYRSWVCTCVPASLRMGRRGGCACGSRLDVDVSCTGTVLLARGGSIAAAPAAYTELGSWRIDHTTGSVVMQQNVERGSPADAQTCSMEGPLSINALYVVYGGYLELSRVRRPGSSTRAKPTLRYRPRCSAIVHTAARERTRGRTHLAPVHDDRRHRRRRRHLARGGCHRERGGHSSCGAVGGQQLEELLGGGRVEMHARRTIHRGLDDGSPPV
jgi:hypothetical protein